MMTRILNCKHFALLSLLAIIMLLQSCAALNNMPSEKNQLSYKGTIIFTDGNTKSGTIRMPMAESKLVKLESEKNERGRAVDYPSKDIDRIEFEPFGSSDKVNVVSFLPTKGYFGKVSHKWLIRVAKGENVSAYIGALTYELNFDGSVQLGGISQRIATGNGSTTVVEPSFPLFMIKAGQKSLTSVALKGGVSFEGSSFRSGVSHFLSDDPQLCEYMRQEKWDFDNIESIIENYNPNRGSEALAIDGKTVTPKPRSLITDHFDGEMIFSLETAIPSDKVLGTQFGIGLRLSAYKFLTYGADLGYASAKYVDSEKRMENHLINNLYTAPVIDDDFSKSGLVRFNTFIGAQLPLNFKKVYVIPAVHLTFGGMSGTGYATFVYGPMGTLDFGFKMKNGGILMLGAGYRKNTPWKDQEGKDEASAPGFEGYKPYNNLVLRLGYKF